MLPKEKTSILGTSEICLYHHFLKPNQDKLNHIINAPTSLSSTSTPTNSTTNETSSNTSQQMIRNDQTAKPLSSSNNNMDSLPLSVNLNLPIAYVNSKMLNADSQPPQIEIQCSLTEPLLDANNMTQGNFAHVQINDILNLPEEWTLKEPSEKDLTSSKNTNTYITI